VLYSLPLDTSGSEREPKLWPNTHFRKQPNAAAADLSLCEAGYTPTPNGTLPLQIDDAFSIVTFTQQFRYLGAISSSSISDDDEITVTIRRNNRLLRARPHARAPADRLQPRQGGRVARSLAELGKLPHKTERNGASSQLGYRWHL
jgi:hypothetical protein